MPSIVTLALWRWRQSGFLLFVTGLGIIAAIMIVCAIPLFSAVTATAELRSLFATTPTNADLMLHISTQGLSTRLAQDLQQELHPLFQQLLQPYLSDHVELSIKTPGLTILSPRQTQAGNLMQLFSTNMQQATPHITLQQGQLPADTCSDESCNHIDVLLTPAAAQSLHVAPGSLITLQLPFSTEANPGKVITQPLALRISGLFTASAPQDAFWHGATFEPVPESQWTVYTILLPISGLQRALDAIAQTYQTKAPLFQLPLDQFWQYRLDPARFTINQLDDLTNQLDKMQTGITNKYGYLQNQSQAGPGPYPYVQQIAVSGATLSNSDGPGILGQFQTQAALSRVPVEILALQITALILIFLSVMAELLVDRQADAIAVLRSRGASSRQIFGSLTTQSIGLSLLALVIGPPLSLLAVSLIARSILAPTQQNALQAITAQPLETLLNIGWLAILAAAMAVIAMMSSLNRATRMDVLTLRREYARSTQRPLWQRLQLDIVAIIVSLVGYAVSLYITNLGGLLDSNTRGLVATPLALIAPIFLLIAAVLLFLRLYPLFLRASSALAIRGRGAPPMLALAQIARAPRQTLRMILLLALASAFAIFTLVFTASQAQQALNAAAYQVGADFSGDQPTSNPAPSLARTIDLYTHIPGVTSASAGYSARAVSAGLSPNISIQVEAIDTSTFARTAFWPAQIPTLGQITGQGQGWPLLSFTPGQGPALPLQSLMAQLKAQENQALHDNVVPVIVDATVWDTLELHPGATFTIDINTLRRPTLHCRAIARVEHISPVGTSFSASTGASTSGTMLVDYQTLNTIFGRNLSPNARFPASLPVNHVWLNTKDDATSVAEVRTILTGSSLYLNNLQDRRALLVAMQGDPFYLSLIGTLAIGSVTALLLALMGSFIASWLNARARLTNFAVLRALGSTPRQVASVLTWEQVMVYLTAMVIGMIFGALLSVTVIPALIFTSTPVSGSAFVGTRLIASQRTLPVQIVLPPSLGIALIIFICICVVALSLMVRIVSRPPVGQALRVNED
jgi:ABC-type antimicrobial peptide transport system permease subunit